MIFAVMEFFDNVGSFGQVNRVANAACKECAVLVETGRDCVYFPNTGKVSALFDFS